ncbi:MAG: hypothetical protein GQ574_20770 [Crocinitomix sp.]|nr:hypothetical protein [Crocinitomix sp.]
MIVNKNTSPQRDLYFLGGKVIEMLDDSKQSDFDFFELYKQLNDSQDVSISLFSLVLDWLFILGVVKNGVNGNVKKCF